MKIKKFDIIEARKYFLTRKPHTNKTDYGHLLVVAGSAGMWGASKLCAEAAYRVGAGYVTLAVDSKTFLSFSKSSKFKSEILLASRKNRDLLNKKTAVVIGPGLNPKNLNVDVSHIFERLLRLKNIPVLLDAGGFDLLLKRENVKLPTNWILTPHEGEMARLLGCTSSKVKKNRIDALKKGVAKFGCVILLKGFHTLIGDPSGAILELSEGNSALAKAGSGDVLSGMIGGLLARIKNPDSLKIASSAAFFHGLISDQWLSDGLSSQSLMPSDIINRLPAVLGRYEG
jgi:hydroxyethylthiazole kinase-like uncharacterized protein yjeF